LPQAAADISARVAYGSESHAASLNNLAPFQQLAGDLPAALTTLDQVRAIKAALPDIGPDHPSYAATLNNIAGVHRAMGDFAAAEPLLLEALRIDTAALGAEHPNTISFHLNLGALYFEWAQTAPPDQAQDLRRKEKEAKALALDLSLRVNGPRHQDTALDRNNAAVRLARAGDMPAAWDQMRMAAAIRLDMLPQHPWTMQCLRAYRTYAIQTGQPAKTLLPALLAEARAQRAAHIAWGQAKLADLLREHGIDGAPSQETANALAQAIAARQAAMQAAGKPVEAWTWPMQQLKNAVHAASLSPDLPAEFEANAAQMLAALASAGNLSDNRGERTAP
jgi:tetratricopeptide (TPR) repeat protein